jgi:hypothetical protein
MKIEFECTGLNRNPAPPGQKPTYNVTLTPVEDSAINAQAFAGTPSATLVLTGLKTLPLGYDARTVLDVGGDPQGTPVQAAPAFGVQSAERRVFRNAGE